SATPRWASPASCTASRRAASRGCCPQPATPRLAWTSSPACWRSSPARGSSCSYGTRPGRRGSGLANDISISITRSYYRNSVGGFLVFDITNRRSFEHVRDWLEEAKMYVQPFRIVFLLVGHKCDLVSQRQVSREEAEKMSAACGMKYIETSAKDATNVEESFTILTRDIYELIKKGEICIQDGWEGVKSGFVPNIVHSSEEAVKPMKQCLC
uniref:Cullin 5 n=1 Tax=Vombatus ursinus TaxID=29139 RepID=A0A4X2L148_VOMUR